MTVIFTKYVAVSKIITCDEVIHVQLLFFSCALTGALWFARLPFVTRILSLGNYFWTVD